jgi:glycosyltransferase involved in cell wall biosynthesis
MKYVDAMITVSPSIQNWYQERFPDVPVALVRNVPERDRGELTRVNLRAKLNVPEPSLLFIFHGGHARGRGIEAILDAFSSTEVGHHVVFMGNGVLAEDVRRAATRCGRIHWLAPVPPDAVLSMAAGADVGLALYEDISLNHRYCLPNKLFEYWLAGIPVLASSLPDQASLVREFKAGWIVSPDRSRLAATLSSLSRQDVEAARAGVERAGREMSWDNEAAQLISIYRRVIRNPQNGVAS